MVLQPRKALDEIGMKSRIAVFHSPLPLASGLCRVVPLLLSFYIAGGVLIPQGSTGAAASNRSSPSNQARIEDGRSSYNPSSKSSRQDQAHITLVSEIIEGIDPSHPQKSSLAQLIVSESRDANVDPLLVASVVRAESMFKQGATSKRGAQGLMQIMPATGRFIAKSSNIKLHEKGGLLNPETNIKLGVWYLRYLLQRFQGDLQRTLVAYNWGPTNLRRALSSGESFPKESVQYVNKVLSHHSVWIERRLQLASLAHESSLG